MSYPPSSSHHSPPSDPFEEFDPSPPQFDQYNPPYARSQPSTQRYHLEDSDSTLYSGHQGAASTYSLASEQEKDSDPYAEDNAEDRPLTLGGRRSVVRIATRKGTFNSFLCSAFTQNSSTKTTIHRSTLYRPVMVNARPREVLLDVKLLPRHVHSFPSTSVHSPSLHLQAWGQRQRVNPRRALTMKVPLTKGNHFASLRPRAA